LLTHVEVVTGDHVDLDLPLAGNSLSIGHHRQDDWVGTAAAHVDVDVLPAILSAKDRQSLANSGSHHERVGRAQTVLVGLGKGELLEVQAQLAHIGLLLDGHLASVGAILAARVAGVHEDGLVLVRDSATSELERAAGAEAVGTRPDRGAGTTGAFGVGQTSARVAVISVAGRVLEADDRQDTGQRGSELTVSGGN